MKTSKIGRLTIHRPESEEELRAGWAAGRNFDGVIFFPYTGEADEVILANLSCTGLIDDERSSEVARIAHTVVIVPRGSLLQPSHGEALMQPPEACVAKKTRSIRARQAAIEAGVAPADTPLVGVPATTYGGGGDSE